jgi:hypothetical protein
MSKRNLHAAYLSQDWRSRAPSDVSLVSGQEGTVNTQRPLRSIRSWSGALSQDWRSRDESIVSAQSGQKGTLTSRARSSQRQGSNRSLTGSMVRTASQDVIENSRPGSTLTESHSRARTTQVSVLPLASMPVFWSKRRRR